jgi:hypothetical protein
MRLRRGLYQHARKDGERRALHGIRRRGINYALRPERLAFCCYRAYFGYLTEYMNTYFELGASALTPEALKTGYFENWIRDIVEFADAL